MKIAVLDVETTGLSVAYDRIVEIAVFLTDEKYNIIEEVYSIINPEVYIPNDVVKIHQVTNAAAAKGPTLEEFYPKLEEILSRADYCNGYNAMGFDRPVLMYEMNRAGRGKSLPVSVTRPWMDAYPIFAKPALDAMFNTASFTTTQRRLADAARALGVEIGRAHSAYDDTKAYVEVLKAATEEGFLFPPGVKFFDDQFTVG